MIVEEGEEEVDLMDEVEGVGDMILARVGDEVLQEVDMVVEEAAEGDIIIVEGMIGVVMVNMVMMITKTIVMETTTMNMIMNMTK